MPLPDPLTAPFPSNRTRLLLCRMAALILLAFAGVYSLLYATHFTFHFAPLRFMDHYRYQANGFWNSQLSLCNDDGTPMSTVDSANFRGRSYSTYGIFPVAFQLVLNNACRLDLTSGFIVWGITFATLWVFFFLATDYLVEIYHLSRAASTLLAAVLSAAVGTTDRFLQLSVVPFSWSQAEAAGALCFNISVWLFLLRYVKQRPSYFWGAGAAAGLALLSKQNYIFASVPLVLFILAKGYREKARVRVWFTELGRFLTPVVLCLVCALAWNYLRFGNMAESGLRYVNASEANPSDYLRPLVHRIPYNLYNHFLAGFSVRTSDLPILYGSSQLFGGIDLKTGYGGLLHNSPMFSLFLSMPLLLFVPCYLAVVAARRRHKGRAFRDQWNILLVAAGVGAFGFYLLLDSAWVRYQYDLIYLWALCTLCVVVDSFQWLLSEGAARRSRALAGMLTVLVIAGLIWQFCVGIDQSLGILAARRTRFIDWSAAERGSDASLRLRVQLIRGALFDEIPAKARWIETALALPAPDPSPVFTMWTARDRGETFLATGAEWISVTEPERAPTASIRFPAWRGPVAEPLVVRGNHAGKADGVGVRYVSQSSAGVLVSFFLDHWGTPILCRSDTVEVTPAHPYKMRFDFSDPLSRMRLWLDGRQVMDCKTAFHRAGEGEFVCGKNTIGFSSFGAEFTGQIECGNLESGSP